MEKVIKGNGRAMAICVILLVVIIVLGYKWSPPRPSEQAYMPASFVPHDTP